jgi:hypothetical protein
MISADDETEATIAKFAKTAIDRIVLRNIPRASAPGSNSVSSNPPTQ